MYGPLFSHLLTHSPHSDLPNYLTALLYLAFPSLSFPPLSLSYSTYNRHRPRDQISCLIITIIVIIIVVVTSGARARAWYLHVPTYTYLPTYLYLTYLGR